jgi:hypothetical protein
MSPILSTDSSLPERGARTVTNQNWIRRSMKFGTA